MPKIKVIGRQPSAAALREVVSTLDSTQDVIVYWGARVTLATPPPDNTLVLNGGERVDGYRQLETFITHGLSTPAITLLIDAAKDIENLGVAMYGRRVWHTRGTDIIGSGRRVKRNGSVHFNKGWEARDYWVEVIPPEHIINEWRIHVFQGRVIARGLKVQTGPPIRKQLVRSRANGWTLSHTENPPKHIKDAARAAVAALNYNLGAVDILEIAKEPGYVLLEVNTAPALLSTYTLDAYVKAFMKIAEGKYRKIYQPEEG